LRTYLLAGALALSVVASFATSSIAAPAIAPVNTAISADEGGQSPIIQIDRRCGRFSHYVPTHRDRHHRLIRGVCVRDHR